MPELPEVETTLRGISPHILGQTVDRVTIRQTQLRWPVAAETQQLVQQTITKVSRRGKYILLHFTKGTLIIHLGMSGSLRITDLQQTHGKHDHIDILFAKKILRFNDPRRFGCFLWTNGSLEDHPLFKKLGPEPFCESFNADWLYHQAKNRKTAVKLFIMDNHIVVGVGNIYANETLFRAGIHPARQANRIAKKRYGILVQTIRTVLDEAIKKGGTTLKDFVNEQGKPGYFQQSLKVYSRANEPCQACHTPIRQLKLGQRSTFFCVTCQR